MAEPGAEVEILVNGLPVGRFPSLDDGRWTYALTLDEPGRHVIDVRATIDGLRIASVAEPFQVRVLPTPTNTPTRTRTSTPTATFTPTSTLTPTPAEPSDGTVRKHPVDGAEYVYISAGEFIMGSSDEDELADIDEKPQVTVYLDGYWIKRTEVTNAEYSQCVEAGACDKLDSDRLDDPEYANHPVTRVNWFEANQYAEWIGGRLPTEAEWEKACRGTDGRIYPWGNDAPNSNLSNYARNVDDTAEVGTYSPQGDSPNGLVDMAGNVWEWTADWYASDYYGTLAGRTARNPQGPESGIQRTLRGGSFLNSARSVRCARRNHSEPGGRSDYVGFRVVSPGL